MQATASQQHAIAFADAERIASGDLKDVARATKERLDAGDSRCILLFDAETSRPIEVDFRGDADDVVARLEQPCANAGEESTSDEASAETGAGPRKPGRPKLGVVSREVTLLPRHWEWLSSQPGGASVTLRKLVEQARRANAGADRRREAQESAYRFMLALAGNEAGFEEANRALFAGDRQRFETETSGWPPDVRDHARRLASVAFDEMST